MPMKRWLFLLLVFSLLVIVGCCHTCHHCHHW
jgi:hypothetical protein